jgi:hypothetical protein
MNPSHSGQPEFIDIEVDASEKGCVKTGDFSELTKNNHFLIQFGESNQGYQRFVVSFDVSGPTRDWQRPKSAKLWHPKA